MCGICFIFNRNIDRSSHHTRLENTLNSLERRGPDDRAILIDDRAGIGHTRLSILDIESSRQPMADPSGRYWLSFNGEIYNYIELRRRLLSRWKFITDGDTEVLLAGLIQEGAPFLAKAEGMWAFVLWDRKKEQALLARDRFGEKPLYYLTGKCEFYCASELPALKRLAARPWTIDSNQVCNYFSYGFALPGNTLYKNVKELPAGCYGLWTPADDSPIVSRYWNIPAVSRVAPKDFSDMLRETMEHAVRIRLRADVEVGAFLSGGIDSFLTSSLSHNAQPLKTFSLAFGEASYDESSYAQRAARHIGSEHFSIKYDESTPRRLLEVIDSRVGQPFYDTSLLCVEKLSELAASKVKVVLSGDGADEFWSGYQRYQGIALMRLYTRLPRGLRKRFRTLIARLPESTTHHSASLSKKVHLFFKLLDYLKEPYIAPRVTTKEMQRRLLSSIWREADLPNEASLATDPDEVRDAMLKDSLNYLPQDILRKVDAGTMHHSLECRAPFLDSKLVNLALSFPSDAHLSLFSNKRLLKQAFKQEIPFFVRYRKKHGFALPVHRWFTGTLSGHLRDMLFSINHPLDRTTVLELLNTHGEYRDNSQILWLITSFLHWLQNENM